MALAVVLLFNLWCMEAAAETILWSGPDTPAHLALSKRYLCWSDDSETPVKRMSICGGEAIALALKMGVPANLTIKDQNIFWIDERSGYSPSGSCFSGHASTRILNKSPLDGTSKTELARGDYCREATDDIVVDETHVYWVNSVVSPDEYYIKKVPIAGGDSTTLVTVTHTAAGIKEMAGDATHIYFTEGSAIKKIPKSGGQIEIVADGEFYRGLALHNGEIFFSGYFDYYTYSLKKVSVLGGSVTTLATVTRDPFEPKNYALAMAADNENLYWVDKKSVKAVPVNGGSITTLADFLNEIFSTIDIAVNGDKVFWIESANLNQGLPATVNSVPTTGGTVTTLFQGDKSPRRLALHSNEIYWTEGGPRGLIEGHGRIAKIGVGGGNATTVIFGVMSDSPPIASDDRYLYIGDDWTLKKVSIDGSITEKMYGADFDIADLATDGTNVYWIMHPFGTVFKMPVSGGQAILLSSQPSGYPGPIRVHNEYVYWITSYDTISKVGVDGSGFVTLATGLPFLDDLVVDDTHVFFAEHDTGRIRRMSIDGGPISTVVGASFPPFHLAVDEHSLYWISSREIGAMLKDGGSPTIIDQQVLSDIYGNGSIAVDPTGVYWTETYIGAIMKHELGECYTSIANPYMLFLLLGE